jgi:hypothetical protein
LGCCRCMEGSKVTGMRVQNIFTIVTAGSSASNGQTNNQWPQTMLNHARSRVYETYISISLSKRDRKIKKEGQKALEIHPPFCRWKLDGCTEHLMFFYCYLIMGITLFDYLSLNATLELNPSVVRSSPEVAGSTSLASRHAACSKSTHQQVEYKTSAFPMLVLTVSNH